MKTLIRSGLALTGMCCAMYGLQAADDNLEMRIRDIEKQLKALQQENADLKAQLGVDSKPTSAALKALGKESKISLGGYIQGQAAFGNAPDARFVATDSFMVRRARLSVVGSFLENFDFKLESDFGNANLASNTDYRAQLTDVFVNWNRYDFANVKFGQFKTPFGYEQLIPDIKTPMAERSLPNDRLTLGRQIGAAVSGEYYEKRLTYSAGVFNGNGVNRGFNDNEEFLYVGRIAGVPVQTKWGKQDVRWGLGVNAFTSDDNGVSTGGFGFDAVPGGTVDNQFVGNRTSWGVDTQFRVGPFEIAAEYLTAHYRPTNDTPADRFDASGWYLMGSWFAVPKKLQALVRYENFDPNTDLTGNTTDEWVFGLNYFVKGDDIKFQLNYLLGQMPGSDDYEGRLLTRVQLVF